MHIAQLTNGNVYKYWPMYFKVRNIMKILLIEKQNLLSFAYP